MSIDFWISTKGVILIFGAVIAAWIGTPFLVEHLFSNNWDQKGQFGDQFGSITALFSGFAFAGLILTLFLQSKELSLTRESVKAQTDELKVSSEALKKQVQEMSNQRVEMEAMKEAQQAQVDYMAKQAFENTFFQMLKLWNEHIEAFGGRSKIGENSLLFLLKDVNDFTWVEDETPVDITPENHNEVYMAVFTSRAENFARPYLLLFLHILKHIHSAQIKGIKKTNYSQILRAQLSPVEKKLLFFNCAFQHKKVLKPLLEEYGILASLDKTVRDKNLHITKYYKPKAFKG